MRSSESNARGLARIEGHLLWAAEVEDARRQAGRFTEQLPWLTTAQREDVERVYAADRLRLSQETLRRICGRIAEVRTEYEDRYRLLRSRCVVTVVVGLTGGMYAVIAALFIRR
ncbi:hypothetical protein SHKM778_39280 [Streptomyces sp. KM77-8]|uniref:Cytochrome C oxidase subunit I n=1 Tax=Streptomyces haneummycinicus TaxID=3074435 RepID=A0AAT9HJP2_9ACTN